MKNSYDKHIPLAGLPHLLAGLLIGVPLLLGAAGYPYPSPIRTAATIALAALFGLAALISFFIAWRRNWPLWSASWAFYWFAFLFVAAGFILQSLGLPDTFNRYNLFYIVLPLGAAWFLYRAARGEARKGLLAGLPVMTVYWLPNMEFVRDDLEGVITIACWTIAALTAVAMLRLDRPIKGLLWALGANVLIGLPYAYAGIYHGGTMNFDAPGANFIQVLRSFLPQFVSSSCLLIGPQLARLFRQLDLRSNPSRAGRYRWILLGLLFTLCAGLIWLWDTLTDSLRVQNSVLMILLPYLAGLAIFILGLGRLLRVAREAGISLSGLSRFSLFLVPLGLPFAVLLPFVELLLRNTFLQSIDLPLLDQFPEFPLALLGLLWIILAVRLLHSLQGYLEEPGNALIAA